MSHIAVKDVVIGLRRLQNFCATSKTLTAIWELGRKCSSATTVKNLSHNLDILENTISCCILRKSLKIWSPRNYHRIKSRTSENPRNPELKANLYLAFSVARNHTSANNVASALLMTKILRDTILLSTQNIKMTKIFSNAITVNAHSQKQNITGDTTPER